MPVVDDRVEHDLHVDAPPEIVFAMFTDPERYVRWMGREATLDPRPGGLYRVVVHERATVAGLYTVVEPHERIEFTWGFEGDPNNPPGSSVVTVTLAAEDGGTRLRLVHAGLAHPALGPHDQGWTGHLATLTTTAAPS